MAELGIASAPRRVQQDLSGPLSILRTRAALAVAVLILVMSLHYAHREYLSSTWLYMGFTYVDPSILTWAAIFFLALLPVPGLPVVFDRPSSLIIFLLFCVVYIPATSIVMVLDMNSLSRYGPGLFAIGASLLLMGITTQRGEIRFAPDGREVVGNGVVGALVGAWALGAVLLFIVYGSIMSFAGLDEIYEQRFAIERSVSAIGYVQTYYTVMISPALVTIGLCRKNMFLIALGFSGAVMSYMIDAQKISLALPFVIGIFYVIFSGKRDFIRSTSIMAVGMSVVIYGSVMFRETEIGSVIATQFVFRALAVPGLTIAQYSDFFGLFGYTWWANITGFGLIIPMPEAYAGDPNWPMLGEIVGSYYAGTFAFVNMNANAFSGEGLAAAGPAGVFVVSVVITGWLRVLDYLSRDWDRKFVMLLTVPIAISMTNVHFSTVMISFGGALFTLILFVGQSKNLGLLGKKS